MTVFGIRARVAQRRAEANQLLTLGRTELDADPAAALAYAVASVERADSPVARRLAIEALSLGPAARSAAIHCSSAVFQAYNLDFSPDGTRLVTGGTRGRAGVPPGRLASEDSGGPSRTSPISIWNPVFAPDGDRVVCPRVEDYKEIRVWSLSAGKLVRTIPMERLTVASRRGNLFWLLTNGQWPTADNGGVKLPVAFRSWSGGDEDPRLVFSWDLVEGLGFGELSPTGTSMAFSRGRGVYIGRLERDRPGAGETPGRAQRRREGSGVFDPTGERLASLDASGEIRLWSVAADA